MQTNGYQLGLQTRPVYKLADTNSVSLQTVLTCKQTLTYITYLFPSNVEISLFLIKCSSKDYRGSMEAILGLCAWFRAKVSAMDSVNEPYAQFRAQMVTLGMNSSIVTSQLHLSKVLIPCPLTFFGLTKSAAKARGHSITNVGRI